MNFGFNWSAVPQWLWYLIAGVIGALLMLVIDIFVLGRWRRSQSSTKVSEYETRIAAFEREQADWKLKFGKLEADAKANADLLAGRDKELADLKLQIGNLRGEVDAGAKTRLGLTGDLKTKEGLLADLKAQLDKLTLDLNAEKSKGVNLTADLTKATAAVKTLEGDKGKLQGDLNAALKAKADAGVELDGLKARFGKLDADFKAEQGKGVNLAAEIGKLTAAAGVSAGLTKALEGDKGKLKADLDAALKAKADAGLELDGLKAKLGKLQGELDAALKAKAEGPHPAEVAKFYADAQASAGLATDLQAKLDAALKERTALQTSLHARDNELGDLKVRLGGLQAQLDKAESAATSAKASASLMTNLQTESADLKLKLGKFETDASAAAKARADLEAKLAAANADANALRVKLDALTAANAKMAPIEEVNALRVRLGDFEARANTATADAAMWRTKIEGLEADKARLGETSDDLNARLGAALADAGMWRAKVEGLEAERAQLGNTSDDLNARLSAALADAAMWRNKHEEAATAKATAFASMESASSKDLADLRLKYDALKAEFNSVNEDRSRLGHELAATRDAHATDKSEVYTLVPALQGQLDKANQHIAALKADLDDDDEERDALKAEIAKLQAQLNAKVAPVTMAAGAAAVGLVDTPPKKRITKPRAAGDKTPYTLSCPQHLSDVKGIGTVFEGRLYAAGIGTYSELANTPREQLIKVLEVSGLQLERFDYDGIVADARRLATETNSEGRKWDSRKPDDFEPIDGIGFTFEKRLYDAGICTYGALIEAGDDELNEIVKPPKFRIPDYASWRAQARKLMGK